MGTGAGAAIDIAVWVTVVPEAAAATFAWERTVAFAPGPLPPLTWSLPDCAGIDAGVTIGAAEAANIVVEAVMPAFSGKCVADFTPDPLVPPACAVPDGKGSGAGVTTGAEVTVDGVIEAVAVAVAPSWERAVALTPNSLAPLAWTLPDCTGRETGRWLA